MLTLTRKVGQKILIGTEIEIVVREVRGRQVRLGIVAPDGMPVYREELYQQLLDEGRDPIGRGDAPSNGDASSEASADGSSQGE